jgi:hypothetical protein
VRCARTRSSRVFTYKLSVPAFVASMIVKPEQSIHSAACFTAAVGR